MSENNLNINVNLSSALGIRYFVHNFHTLASDLSLLSLNAQIASAKMGDAGRAFKVITSENSGISSVLTGLAKRIRTLTYDWAKMMASTSQENKKLDLYLKSRAKLGKNSKLDVVKLGAIETALRKSIEQFSAKQAHLVNELLQIIDDMEKSLRLINYVKSGILVESSFLENESGSKASFQHLAEQMEEAANKIREVASLTRSQLKQVK